MPDPSDPSSPHPPEPASPRAWQLLEEALKLPTAERPLYLEKACADSANLRIEVQTLLKAVEQVEDIFTAQQPHPPTPSPVSLADAATVPPSGASGFAPPSSLLGTQGAGEAVGATTKGGTIGAGSYIGPFRLLSILGEGGFGVVFLGERREPMVQRVAIKVIKPGMDSGAVIARFEQERQVLAMMDHPAIAKVFDAGTTTTGRPYFVMEYVRGEALNRYCDKNRLSLRDRLELFIGVCDAVQHAHNRGIIHRDLKPSNVLVTVVDNKPQPKVIDFGVAKAITHIAAASEVFTQQGMFIGTPEYMSPEQAEMGPTDIDTRSDVFSLGVMLYELLTGALPIDSKTLRQAGIMEIQRMIREADRPRPSTKLSQLNDSNAGSGERAATARKTDLDHLSRELRRELDWIPLKALRTDRTERYRSAADLADDIRNYLDGRAVVARPPSKWYSARKFVRQNRGTVGAVAAVILALAVGGGVAAWKWRVAVAARAETEAQRDAVARTVDFVAEDLLAPPDESDGPYLRVPTEILDRAAADMKQRFEGWPSLQARMQATLGRAYLAIGEAQRARDILEHGRALVESGAKVPPKVDDQISYDLSTAYMRTFATDESVGAIEPLVKLRDAQLGTSADQDEPFAALLYVLGNAYKRAGRFSDAKHTYQRAIAIYNSVGQGTAGRTYSLRVNQLLCELGILRKAAAEAEASKEQKSLAQVDADRRTLLAAFRDLANSAAADLGERDTRTIAARTEQAALEGRVGEYADANAHFASVIEALQSRERTRNWRTAETLARYGNMLLVQKRAADASVVLRQALEGYRDPAVRGPDSPDTVTVSLWLATALDTSGDPGSAISVLETQFHDLGDPNKQQELRTRVAARLKDLCTSIGDTAAAARWAEAARPR